jgi:outer membrane protein assembly factor BamA
MEIMKRISLLIFSVILSIHTYAQIDSTNKPFKKFDILPAISYAPETKLTLGIIGFYYFDLAKQSTATKLSNVEFLAAYTLANQIVIETRWDVYADDNAWRYRGEAFFNRYPDRNYGLGNNADLRIVDIEDDNRDTLNYFRFDSDRIRFAPIALKRLKEHLYLGLQLDLEYVYRMQAIADLNLPIYAGNPSYDQIPVEGWRVGLGFNLLHDSRDNSLNALSGSYFEMSNHLFSGYFGSEYDYVSLDLDGRYYVPIHKRHTLAMRGTLKMRFANEVLPLRGLARVGGYRFMRGYFQGTFQDKYLLAFELEYRIPFWKPDLDAPIWKIWKRLGLVTFISGAEVFHQPNDIGSKPFNMAAGVGLRILFNKANRLNLRIDYGVGLRKKSGGPGKRQTGLYFFLAEAF